MTTPRRSLLRTLPGKVSRSQMILCCLATTFPLVVGYARGESLLAIYASLAGYFLTANEVAGTLKHRFFVVTVTFFMLATGFSAGSALHHLWDPYLYWTALAVASYWVGLMAGEGAEWERAFLFATLELVVGYHARDLATIEATKIFGYALVSYAFTIIATGIQVRVLRTPNELGTNWRHSLWTPIASFRTRQVYAITYVLTVLATAASVEAWQLNRGYWAVVTVLFVMKPDRTLSLYRAFQRFVGTAAAVLIAEALMHITRSPLAIIAVIALSAFFIPWAMKRNYWLVCLFVSMIVLLLLDLASLANGNYLVPLLRLRATAIGSIFAVAGVGIAALLARKKPPGEPATVT